MTSAQAAEQYDGPAELVLETEVLPVEVTLRGFFQPIDGRFHWYGRIAHVTELTSTVPAGATVLLRTPHGRAHGRLSDVDPWNRVRISGTGRPPFRSRTPPL